MFNILGVLNSFEVAVIEYCIYIYILILAIAGTFTEMSNKGSGSIGKAPRGRTGAPSLPQNQSGSPGSSTRIASGPRDPVDAAHEDPRVPRVTGSPNRRPADVNNPQARLASPVAITRGATGASRDASSGPGTSGSPSRRPREGEDGQPRLSSPAPAVRNPAGTGTRTPPSHPSRSSPPTETRNPSSQRSEGEHQSDTSSGSPGSGTHGKPPSKASSRDSPGSDKTADSADSLNMGEAFIQRITGQASNAGPSNPPTNFVLCIDGTGNDMIHENEVKNTNIAKMTDVIKYGKHGDRMTIVAYQQGLGNKSKSSKRGGEGTLAGWAAKLDASFDKLWPSESTIARLVSINYAYISMSVCPNKDRIFLFGFSRGAYIAQIAAAVVADMGIVSNQIYMEKFSDVEHSKIVGHIVKTWVKYKGQASPETMQKALGSYRECLIRAKIQFVGVFDMVASVGKPDLGNADLQSNAFRFAESVHDRPNILNAYHAVAISEHRNQFKPVLWKEGTTDQRRNISQVWFPGFHTSIGGGTKTQGIMIYHITLVWMLSKCSGLVYNDEEIEKFITDDAQHAPAMIRKDIPDSKKGIWAKPGMGDHVRTELGSAPIDKVHRVCDEIAWAFRCASIIPNVHGTVQRPIQTKAFLEKKRIDKFNEFESKFHLKMFEAGSGSRPAPVPAPGRAGRDMAFILDS